VKRLAVILARGGSKRIINKNIRLFHGKPIISYSIKAINKSKIFSRIHISTESEKVIAVLKKLNFVIDFKRPKFLAGDNVASMDVIKFVYEVYKKKGIHFDEVWIISACAPLMKASDIVRASKILKNIRNKMILSVSEYSVPIEWAFLKNKNNNLKPLAPGSFKIRSQDLKKKYHDIGYFYGMPSRFLENKTKNWDNNFLGLEIEKHRAVDIDKLSDWKLAERLFKS